MQDGKVYNRCKDMVVRQIGNDTLLIPIRDSKSEEDYIYSLNSSAAFVLSLINGRRPTCRIKKLITHNFQKSSGAEIDKQLTVILRELKEIRAIE